MGVGRDRDQRLGRGLEQEVVDDGLVVERQGADRRRQREADMIIGDRQEFGLALGQPLSGGCPLTLRAVAVATGVVGDARVGAILAALDVSAERRGPAALDRRHDFQLSEADVASVGFAPRRPMGSKDVGDLQARPRHAAAVRRAAIGSPG